MGITLFTLRAVAEALIETPYIFIIIMLAVILYRKNKKTVIMQKMIIGENINSPFELTISQFVIGILAGAASSVILTYLGIMFMDEVAIIILFMLSIMLMFVGNRFVCFSYSSAILGTISIALEILSKAKNGQISNFEFLRVNILMLISLVAVLHIVEGILVILDGSRGAIPVFTNRDNKIIGGFALKRYWVVPIAVLIIMQNKNLVGTVGIGTPDWWPIIKSYTYEFLKDAIITALAFYGVIGYSGVTFTKTKEKKALSSGLFILTYGLVLLAVAQIAKINMFGEIFVVIFTPLAHECMLRIQVYFENNGVPKFFNKDEGIMVLEVAPKSPAHEMGIQTGDVLVEINNEVIVSEEDIVNALAHMTNFVWFKIKKVTGTLEEVKYLRMNRQKRLGIVFIPKGIPKNTVVMKVKDENFKDVLDKFKNNDKDKK